MKTTRKSYKFLIKLKRVSQCLSRAENTVLASPHNDLFKRYNKLIKWRVKSRAIICDNGPEYIYQALRDWAQEMDIELMHNPARQANEKWLYWTI